LKIRRLAALSLVLIAVPQGCASKSLQPTLEEAPQNTAVVLISDRKIGDPYFVKCRKSRWLLTVETVDASSGFTAMVRLGADLDVQYVEFRRVTRFTGSAWRGGVGEAEAHRNSGILNITGTAYGYYTDSSRRPITLPFVIKTVC
jgi:ipoprotein LpqH